MGKIEQTMSEVEKVIKGKHEVIRFVLMTILADGHILMEDIPGVGKTTLALAFSRALALDYHRVQFTPDVLPGDITGFSMYNKKTEEFEYVQGAAFCSLLLADEINRTSPKTQSALLEIMEERRVTVDGVTRKLPEPFVVMATQNPYGSAGTQRLPESQLDRFMSCVSMGYPEREAELEILKGEGIRRIDQVQPVMTREELLIMKEQVRQVYVDELLYGYITDLCRLTRNHALISLGVSPRGTLALLAMAKAHAFCADRNFVTPQDIHGVLAETCGHRILLSAKGRAGGCSAKEVLEQIVKELPVPQRKR